MPRVSSDGACQLFYLSSAGTDAKAHRPSAPTGRSRIPSGALPASPAPLPVGLQLRGGPVHLQQLRWGAGERFLPCNFPLSALRRFEADAASFAEMAVGAMGRPVCSAQRSTCDTTDSASWAVEKLSRVFWMAAPGFQLSRPLQPDVAGLRFRDFHLETRGLNPPLLSAILTAGLIFFRAGAGGEIESGDFGRGKSPAQLRHPEI